MPEIKTSYQKRKITVLNADISFDQMAVLEEALNDKYMDILTKDVDVNVGQSIVDLGQLFGLEISVAAEEADPHLQEVDETYAVEQ